MNRFAELCADHRNQQAAAHEYWDALQSKAEELAIDLASYLDVPAKGYQKQDGPGSSPYVFLTQPGEDKPVDHPSQLKGERSVLHFQIVVVLERGPDVFPKSSILIPLKMGMSGDLLKVWSDSGDIKADVVPTQPSSHEALHKQIFDTLKSALQKRPGIV